MLMMTASPTPLTPLTIKIAAFYVSRKRASTRGVACIYEAVTEPRDR